MWSLLPKVIVMCLLIGNMLLHIAKHGEDNAQTYNSVSGVVNTLLWIALLGWGGFWDL